MDINRYYGKKINALELIKYIHIGYFFLVIFFPLFLCLLFFFLDSYIYIYIYICIYV